MAINPLKDNHKERFLVHFVLDEKKNARQWNSQKQNTVFPRIFKVRTYKSTSPFLGAA